MKTIVRQKPKVNVTWRKCEPVPAFKRLMLDLLVPKDKEDKKNG